MSPDPSTRKEQFWQEDLGAYYLTPSYDAQAVLARGLRTQDTWQFLGQLQLHVRLPRQNSYTSFAKSTANLFSPVVSLMAIPANSKDPGSKDAVLKLLELKRPSEKDWLSTAL